MTVGKMLQNFKGLVCKKFKNTLLHSHLEYFPQNLEFSEERERFHQDIKCIQNNIKNMGLSI